MQVLIEHLLSRHAWGHPLVVIPLEATLILVPIPLKATLIPRRRLHLPPSAAGLIFIIPHPLAPLAGPFPPIPHLHLPSLIEQAFALDLFQLLCLIIRPIPLFI